MKSISLAFNAPSVTLPLGYHHQVQGLIYTLLYRGSELLHDKGFDYGMRQYKLFTFSSLRGGKVISGHKLLHFDNTIFLDVRCVCPEFCEALLMGLKSDMQFDLLGQPLTVHSIKIDDTPIVKSKLHVKMLSPLTIHKTNEDGYTHYLEPLAANFSDEINNNFYRKYYAFYERQPIAEISIKARAVGAQDKYVTLYKKAGKTSGRDIYITGWRGEFELNGNPEYLNFLYYCGLGARNSAGFGMFEPL